MYVPTYPVYRVGMADTPNGVGGLWYNKDGQATGEIHHIHGLLNQFLPMPYDAEVGEGKWIPAVDQLPALSAWFPVEDVELLAEHGRCLWVLYVTDDRTVPGHILFREADVVEAHPISIKLYKSVLGHDDMKELVQC